jgi:hypothetical protein
MIIKLTKLWEKTAVVNFSILEREKDKKTASEYQKYGKGL